MVVGNLKKDKRWKFKKYLREFPSTVLGMKFVVY